ncbi:MAG TPA: ATP-binding protein [Gaiellaceae bacterium]|nr:ATP-binding protein [Gaiellaceae bacterium]
MTGSIINRDWVARRRQRLLYGLIGLSLAATVGAAVYSGLLLRHIAVVQRQTQRTQALGQATLRTYAFSVAPGLTQAVGLTREATLQRAASAWADLAAHHPAEAELLRPAFEAYHAIATRVLGADAPGSISRASRLQLQRALARLGLEVRAEQARQEHEVNVATPRARYALVASAIVIALLVALLALQFELERRAGRIDRDNAARAAELVRLRDEFVAVVSHELRTPLTSIVGYLELIQEDAGNLTAEQDRYLATIERGADRLTELVGDLLMVAAAERGPLALDRTAVDLDALARRAIGDALPAADAKEIQLTLAGGGAGVVDGDERRLAQMLDNLLSNAIKFTPASGTVSLRTSAAAAGAVVEVSDTGTGIAPGDLEHLFEPFFRSSAANARGTPGTGLGLSITKALVEAHGGTIAVESRLGAGTTFRVTLPALVTEAAPAA